jgi:hypothetical protein
MKPLKRRICYLLACATLISAADLHAALFQFRSVENNWPDCFVEITQTAFDNRQGEPSDIISFSVTSPLGFTFTQSDPWSLGPFYLSSDRSSLTTFELIAFSGWNEGVKPPWIAFFKPTEEKPGLHFMASTDGNDWRNSYGAWELVPVPESSTYITGALLMLPFGLRGIRLLRNRKQA